MAYGYGTGRDRATSVAAVALVHAAIGLVLLRGWAVPLAPEQREPTVLLDLAPEPPPEPPATPPPAEARADAPRPKDPEGAASPANLRDTPVPVVAPEPIIPLPVPPPITAAPVAATGDRAESGAADIPGPGTGAGGVGDGRGSGRFGDGTGGGGGGGTATGPRHIRGAIYGDDHPDAGVVGLSFTVAPSGRVTDCRVTRTSGNRDLDRTTCRLIQRRFRYEPARNSAGEPVAATITGQHVWEVSPTPEDVWVEPTIPDD